MSQHDDVNAFLTGGGVTSAKFPQMGTRVGGPILHMEKQQQRDMDTGTPMTWDDGKPREQICVHVQTTLRDPAIEEDDGVRALYVKGNMLKAVREALRKAGARMDLGGELWVTYTADGEQKRRGFNAPKLYDAVYTPPASSVDGLLGTAPTAAAAGQPAQPYVPHAPAAPAAPAVQLPGAMSFETYRTLDPAVKAMLWPSFPPDVQALLIQAGEPVPVSA